MTYRDCTFCKHPFSMDLSCCPHCWRPSLFPNVDHVTRSGDCAEVEKRYERQMSEAEAVGRTAALSALETKVASSSACKALPAAELQRLASSETATAATYYQQIRGNSRIPDSNDWDQLRRIADATFFRSFGENIHFAALSTSGGWLKNYGDGAVFFKDEMIGHRATVFEENTATWVDKRKGDLSIPLGHRTTWDLRAKLAVAKLGFDVISGKDNFDSLLLTCGDTSASDCFVEVHIYGSFTFRSIETLIIRPGVLNDLMRESIEERAAQLGVNFKEITS